MKKIFFTPGPAALFTTTHEHIIEALDAHIPSISHRSRVFKDIFANTGFSLKKLLHIPEEYYILFVASGTEAMERIIENCVEKHSFHFVNGSFSQRFYETAKELNKNPIKYCVEDGKGFYLDQVSIPDQTELICLTQNETSTGVTVPLELIYAVKKKYPEKLIVLDIVSSAPYANVDYSQIDITFFSVQKAFGLPAGLGVIVINPRVIEKAKYLFSKNLSIGSYHSFPSLAVWSEKYQTIETPNVLGIYLLGKVTEDMLKIGIEKIRKDIDQKAKLLYDFFDKSEKYMPFVKVKQFRSPTVIVPEVKGGSTQILEKLKEKGMIVGDGYGIHKGKQLRIANFPVHTREDIKYLISLLQ